VDFGVIQQQTGHDIGQAWSERQGVFLPVLRGQRSVMALSLRYFVHPEGLPNISILVGRLILQVLPRKFSVKSGGIGRKSRQALAPANCHEEKQSLPAQLGRCRASLARSN
jgi:hypothetical protein